MVKRKIVKIDEELCDGCGLCIPECPERAIQIVDGKARLVKEFYCDGLGACLGVCPTGALTIEEREAEAYDEEATIARIIETAPDMLDTHLEHLKEYAGELPEHHSHKMPPGITGCPSAQTMSWRTEETGAKPVTESTVASQLRQWPIQLHLVSPYAPYLHDAELLIVADCVPFAYGNFHQDLLKGKPIVIGCPKLDDIQLYKQKLTEIFRQSQARQVTVLHMEVPCCFGLVHAVKQAIAESGREIPCEEKVIGIRGELKSMQ